MLPAEVILEDALVLEGRAAVGAGGGGQVGAVLVPLVPAATLNPLHPGRTVTFNTPRAVVLQRQAHCFITNHNKFSGFFTIFPQLEVYPLYLCFKNVGIPLTN